ncbi:hypothetical protein [Aureicoccus marinus]|jgi:hypothetical protein|uniref:Uncharacterized protein n=1 Tax=Aureicoccus marinus TaxID=754435 RepID=A0A2S7T3K9_9FLAO|nr:hypothetical protein [Aureicoccus marinus]PQJ14483.1 hypothetical protein BST99_00805 [Aureicoccus marinus]
MIKSFVEKLGWINVLMLVTVLSIIVVAEVLFFSGRKLDAIFIGFWAPTILGFMNYLKINQ